MTGSNIAGMIAGAMAIGKSREFNLFRISATFGTLLATRPPVT
jgi:hypothetical protein